MKLSLNIVALLGLALMASGAVARQYEQGSMPAVVVLPTFPAVERDGMLLSFKGWTGRTSAEAGPNGLTLSRSFSISLAVSDPAGKRPIQIVGPVRLNRLTDEAGRDLSASTRITMSNSTSAIPTTVTTFAPRADPSQSYGADGRPQSSSVVMFSLAPCASLPSAIKEMSGEIRVAVPGDVVDHPCLLRASEEWTEVAPNISVRIDSLPRSANEYPQIKGAIRFKRSVNADGTTSLPTIVNLAVQDREPDTMMRGSGTRPARVAASASLTETGSLVTFELGFEVLRPSESLDGKTLMLTVANSIDHLSMPFKFTNIPIGIAAPESASTNDAQPPAAP